MSTPSTDDQGFRRFPPSSRPRILLFLIGTILLLTWISGLHRVLDERTLIVHRADLLDWVARRPVLAPFAFTTAYAAAVAFSIPGATMMTIAGGLLFGTTLGAAFAVLGATSGSCLLFLAARFAFAGTLERRGGPGLRRAAAVLRQEGGFYLLTLRLLPVVPFWLVNLAAALAEMRLLPFAAATVVGIVPGTVIFASFGAGLGNTLDEGRLPSFSDLASPSVLLPLFAMACSSLAAAWWRGRRFGTH